MRALVISLTATLTAAAPAFAQGPNVATLPPAENTRAACTDGLDNDGDGHLDCADQDCQDFTFCSQARTAGGVANLGSTSVDDIARLRGKGTMRVVIGSVLLSLGVVVGGLSALPWTYGSGHYLDSSPGMQGAIAMDVIGVAMIGAGTTLLAIGAGNLAEARRPKLTLSASSAGVRF